MGHESPTSLVFGIEQILLHGTWITDFISIKFRTDIVTWDL